MQSNWGPGPGPSWGQRPNVPPKDYPPPYSVASFDHGVEVDHGWRNGSMTSNNSHEMWRQHSTASSNQYPQRQSSVASNNSYASSYYSNYGPRSSTSTTWPSPASPLGPPPPMPPPVYKAIHGFTSQSGSELPLAKDELVTVSMKGETGWWLASRLIKPSDQGWVPSSYLEQCAEPSRPPPPAPEPSSSQKKHHGFRLPIHRNRNSSSSTGKDSVSRVTSNSPGIELPAVIDSTLNLGFGEPFKWSSVHNVVRGERDIETLKMHHYVNSKKWQILTDAKVIDEHMILYLNSFSLIANGKIEGELRKIPGCPHIKDSKDFKRAVERILKASNEKSTFAYAQQDKRIETNVFRCCYCPSEYRFKVAPYKLDHDRNQVKTYRLFFHIMQWTDFGKCDTMEEREWQTLTVTAPTMPQSIGPYALEGLPPVKSRFEGTVGTAREETICCLEELLPEAAAPAQQEKTKPTDGPLTFRVGRGLEFTGNG